MSPGEGKPANACIRVTGQASDQATGTGLGSRDALEVPVEALIELYRFTEWAGTRTAESVAAALQNTFLLLTGWHGGRCVAMLRILSDGVYRALIDDVVVHPDFRGWGRLLMEAALAHPRLRDVEELALFTVIPKFYERFGFTPTSNGMQLRRAAPSRVSYRKSKPLRGLRKP